MSCTEYATGKWKCPVTFIHRDYLDPIIKKRGVQVFNKERWGAVQNLYVRYNGAKAQYVVPDGYVIVGVAGKLAMLTDLVRDPSGGMKSQVFYRFSHFYIGELKQVNKYEGEWENSIKKVELPGNNELQRDWEFDTQTFDQKFVRGCFLTGMMMHQGALAPMESGPMPINLAVTIQTKHYLKGYMKEYTFGDKRAGISKPAGLNIPDFRRTISGIKYDASVIYFNPFFEVEYMFVKDVWAELPDDSFEQPDKDTGGRGTTNTDTTNPEVPDNGDKIPVKTDTGADSGSGGSTGVKTGGGSTGVETSGGSTGGETSGGSTGGETSGGSTQIISEDKTFIEKGLDFYNDNKILVTAALLLIMFLVLMAPDDVPPPRTRPYSPRREYREKSNRRR